MTGLNDLEYIKVERLVKKKGPCDLWSKKDGGPCHGLCITHQIFINRSLNYDSETRFVKSGGVELTKSLEYSIHSKTKSLLPSSPSRPELLNRSRLGLSFSPTRMRFWTRETGHGLRRPSLPKDVSTGDRWLHSGTVKWHWGFPTQR